MDEEEEEREADENDKDEHKSKEAAPTKDDDEDRETVLPGSVAVTQQKSIFLPLTWARLREMPVDEEYDEQYKKVIELRDNPKRIMKLKRTPSTLPLCDPMAHIHAIAADVSIMHADFFAQVAFEMIGSQRPFFIRPLGPPVVWMEQYWFDIVWPDYPPTQYEHSGWVHHFS